MGRFRAGESIGFMVTAGKRGATASDPCLQERSNVVVVPATDDGSFTF